MGRNSRRVSVVVLMQATVGASIVSASNGIQPVLTLDGGTCSSDDVPLRPGRVDVSNGPDDSAQRLWARVLRGRTAPPNARTFRDPLAENPPSWRQRHARNRHPPARCTR